MLARHRLGVSVDGGETRRRVGAREASRGGGGGPRAGVGRRRRRFSGARAAFFSEEQAVCTSGAPSGRTMRARGTPVAEETASGSQQQGRRARSTEAQPGPCATYAAPWLRGGSPGGRACLRAARVENLRD